MPGTRFKVNNQQEFDFSKRKAAVKADGYSYETSLPAYQENELRKIKQQTWIVTLVSNGAACTLKQLAELTGLPDSTVAGRVNDAIKENQLSYEGNVEYKGRKRKKIVVWH